MLFILFFFNSVLKQVCSQTHTETHTHINAIPNTFLKCGVLFWFLKIVGLCSFKCTKNTNNGFFCYNFAPVTCTLFYNLCAMFIVSIIHSH